MPQKFLVSVKITYKKDGDKPAPGKIPSKKEICEYLTKKKFVTKLAKRIAPVGGVTVSGAKLDEQLNLTFNATYKHDTNYMGNPVTAKSVKEEMKDSVGIEKCSGSDFPGPCYIPTADGKDILGHVKIMNAKVRSNLKCNPRKQQRYHNL